VDFLPAYRQLGPAWTADEAAALDAVLAAPARHAWLYGSSQAAAHLWAEATRRGQAEALAQCPALCTHARIADSARRLGHHQVVETRPEAAEVAAALRNAAAPG
jgi:uroporphyrinogen-III synthase